jgi:hypothetical protein
MEEIKTIQGVNTPIHKIKEKEETPHRGISSVLQ